MSQKSNSKKKHDFKLEIDKCIFLGKNRRGFTYKLDDGKVMKIYYKVRRCEKKQLILKKLDKHKMFPKVHYMEGNCLIREYINGINLRNYIKKNGFNEELAKKLIDMFMEFQTLKFSRIDIKVKKVYVMKDGSFKVIPFSNSYKKKIDVPEKFIKSLTKLGVINIFMKVLKEYKPKLYKKWSVDQKRYEDPSTKKQILKKKQSKKIIAKKAGEFSVEEDENMFYKDFDPNGFDVDIFDINNFNDFKLDE
jgi:RIO-like serine/threonine protein kinase